MSIADWSEERLRDVQRGTYSTELAVEVIRLRGYQREAAHEMVQAAANLRNLTAMCEQHKAERDQLARQVASLTRALVDVLPYADRLSNSLAAEIETAAEKPTVEDIQLCGLAAFRVAYAQRLLAALEMDGPT